MTPRPTLGRLVRTFVDRVAAPPSPSRDLAGRRRRITFVAVYAFATGGVPRTIFAVANELATRGHEVEVVSVYRTHPSPYMWVHPAVRVSWLEDRVNPEPGGKNLPRARRDATRVPRERRLDRLPSELSQDAYPSLSGLTDLKLQRKLRSLPPGIVVATRPELAVAASRWTHGDVITLSQEHLTFRARPERLREALAGIKDELDALLTLTDADADAWRRLLGPTTTMLRALPNASPFPVGEPASLSSKTVIAAGRLTSQKAFDRLIDAFAPVSEAHPDWQLHIYGTGKREEALRRQVEELGLVGKVRLMGFSTQFEDRLAEASVYAMSSRYEGLPMVLLESMSKGVPPVSVDCPEGPRQLIRDGENGLLVGRGDVPGLTRGLLRLVEDEQLRRRLGAGALESARSYQIDVVTDQWEAVFDELVRRRESGAAGRGQRRSGSLSEAGSP